MHIVTYDAESYASVEEALGEKDSLAVYGVFFEVGGADCNSKIYLINYNQLPLLLLLLLFSWSDFSYYYYCYYYWCQL